MQRERRWDSAASPVKWAERSPYSALWVAEKIIQDAGLESVLKSRKRYPLACDFHARGLRMGECGRLRLKGKTAL